MSALNQLSPEDAEEERKSFLSIIQSFKCYRASSLERVDKTEIYLNTLPSRHQVMLERYRLHLLRIRSCIDTNHKIAMKIIEDVDTIFEEEAPSGGEVNCYHQIHRQLREAATDDAKTELATIKAVDTERVQITLKQIARDWSAEGADERNQCYKPIIDTLVEFYKDAPTIGDIRVLVPGAGLGRLTYEIAYRGFYCEGNEFSYFMLLAANFLLNRCTSSQQYTLYPWVHQYVNNLMRNDQTMAISFPDVSPIQSPPTGAFNMVAGDFLQVYRQPNDWDCVATCFFIDCANNVIDFIETIFNILKPNGIWINVGPLLYHYADHAVENSIEPSYEDIVTIIETVGFEILRNETNVPTKYTQNNRSMFQSTYSSIFMVCKKPAPENASK